MPFTNGKYGNYQDNTSTNTHRAGGMPGMENHNLFNPALNNNVQSDGLAQTSTNIFIYSNGSIVGMIQSFTINENRNVTKLQAIGYEGVVQAVPGNTNGGTLSVSRIALYQSNLWGALGLTTSGKTYNPTGSKVHTGSDEAFGHNKDTLDYNKDDTYKVASNMVFKTLRDQRVPLEIQVKTKASGSGNEFVIDRYVDCWLQSYSKAYTVGNITVSEQATISYADVF